MDTQAPGAAAFYIHESPVPTPENQTTQKPDRIRHIEICQLDRGYTVSVGCQTFAIESDTLLITLLSAYILKPTETENLYYQGKLFK